jgi:glucan endo-1,3-alpha-glucosidase
VRRLSWWAFRPGSSIPLVVGRIGFGKVMIYGLIDGIKLLMWILNSCSKCQSTVNFEPATDDNRIVSWNDFAEAHYIGPVYTQSEVASGSYDYVENMPHEALRDLLPYYIARFKGNGFVPSKDQMQYWYRISPAASGPTCGVVGNNADQGQTEGDPNAYAQDKIFFSALLSSAAEVHVQIGSNPEVIYQGTQGVNHWSQNFDGQFGSPNFSVVRDGVIYGSSTNGVGTPAIVDGPTANGCTNYNFWVGSF